MNISCKLLSYKGDVIGGTQINVELRMGLFTMLLSAFWIQRWGFDLKTHAFV